LSVVVGFYRVCVIDQILAHSPADYVRRPPVPTESPTLGLGHLQFEALLTIARLSIDRNDFALIAMLDLLGVASALHLTLHSSSEKVTQVSGYPE
jgi:hypothetical protein